MSTSLRDQLLKAGLISKQQANEAERQLQRQERRPPRNSARASAAPVPVPKVTSGEAAKIARDQALDRKRQEKAEKKSRLAQIKQLIEQSRLPLPESGEPYSFIDGAKIRRITIDGALREGLGRGEIAIVRYDGGYDLVPASAALRIQQRDEQALVKYCSSPAGLPGESEEGEHPVPDDLIW